MNNVPRLAVHWPLVPTTSFSPYISLVRPGLFSSFTGKETEAQGCHETSLQEFLILRIRTCAPLPAPTPSFHPDFPHCHGGEALWVTPMLCSRRPQKPLRSKQGAGWQLPVGDMVSPSKLHHFELVWWLSFWIDGRLLPNNGSRLSKSQALLILLSLKNLEHKAVFVAWQCNAMVRVPFKHPLDSSYTWMSLQFHLAWEPEEANQPSRWDQQNSRVEGAGAHCSTHSSSTAEEQKEK